MKLFVDYAKNTSLHGIKYTVLPTTSLIEKIFWIIIIISSLIFSFYLTNLFWTRYTSIPTRTTIQNAFAPVTSIPFPGITICSGNKISERKVNTFLTKLEANEEELLIIKNLFSYLIYLDLDKREEFVFNSTELSIAQKVLDQNDYSDMTRLIKHVSQRCEDLIIRCAWNKKQVPCNKLFEASFTIDGRCCSFNYIREGSLKSPIYTLYYGLSTGLKLLLKPESNDDLAGVTVIIHSPEDIPGSTHNLRNYVSVGRVNYMQIDGSKRECSQEVKILPVKHRRCLYSNEKQLRYFSKYTDSNCLPLCEAMSIYELCSCVPYYYSDFIDDKPLCDVQKLPCFQNIRINVSADSCGCISQCEDEFYDVKLATSKFVYNPDIWMMDFLEGVNDTENSLLLNIFFSTNRQTIWFRDIMTSVIYLLSSFGGIYSLFLGCSIITLLEILYYCFKKCCIKPICEQEDKSQYQKQVKIVQKPEFQYHIYILSKDSRVPKGSYPNPIMPYVN